MSNVLESGGLYSFKELLSDAKACPCEGTLRAEDHLETSMYGRRYRRIACSCGRKGPWSTAPVTMWNHSRVNHARAGCALCGHPSGKRA